MTKKTHRKTLKFWYHPTEGPDADGNGGPDRTASGWMTCVVPDTGNSAADRDKAVSLLPKKERDKISKTMIEYYANFDAEPSSTQQFIEDFCGWGVPWTHACEEWDEMEGT